MFYYAAPALLVLVACLQLFRAHTQHLTPWKGGGFGMFASADMPGWRSLRTYLVTPQGEALALFGSLPVQTARVLNMPDTHTLERVARSAAEAHWKLVSTEDVLDDVLALPEDLKGYFVRSGAVDRYYGGQSDSTVARSAEVGEVSPLYYVSHVALPLPASAEAPPPGLLAVRVEVHRLRYDVQGRRASSELLNAVTLDLR